MQPDAKFLPLTEWIRDILQTGMMVTQDVLDYMEATFGTSDLSEILAHADSCEIDTLLELLFYPDINLQVRYESRFGQIAYSSRDQAAILSILSAAPLKAAFILPAHPTPVHLQIPAHALAAFIQRLRITWQPAPQLAEILSKKWQNRQRIHARVHLRNARLAWHPDQVHLMDRFLSMMPAEGDDTETCLEYLLTNLSELNPGVDHYMFLISKKFFYFQSLCNAEDFERKRHSSNMEILMLQGVRAAHGSIDQWRHKMRLVDQICQTLFGRTQFFQQPGEHSLNLENGNDSQNIEEIIRLLS